MQSMELTVLCDSAATIALWRPRTRRLGPDAASDSKDTWFDLVHQKIRTAATNMNTVLHKIISDRLIDYMGPMTYVQNP